MWLAPLVALLLADPAATRDIELGGRVMTYVRAPLTSADRTLQQLSSTAWIDAQARMTKGTFAKISASGDLLTPSIEKKVEARGTIREAYAGAHDDAVEVRIGQQMVSWSNADLAMPLDLFLARDYTFFSATPDAQKIGAPSVLFSVAPPAEVTPLRLAAIVQPVAPVSKMLVPPGLLPAIVQLDPVSHPTMSIANTEIGVKLGWAPGGWDAALVGFRGFNHVPEAFLVSATPQEVVVGRTLRPILAGGLQASATAGDWVLRFESAYVSTENDDGRDSRKQPTHVDTTVGVERPLGDRFRVQTQGIARVHPRWLTPDLAPADNKALLPVERAIANANAVTFDYNHQVRPGATLRLAYTSEDERLEIELAGMAYFVGFDWVVQPQIAWRVLDALELRAGVQMFGGHHDGALGALHDYSGAFAQSTYTF